MVSKWIDKSIPEWIRLIIGCAVWIIIIIIIYPFFCLFVYVYGVGGGFPPGSYYFILKILKIFGSILVDWLQTVEFLLNGEYIFRSGNN